MQIKNYFIYALSQIEDHRFAYWLIKFLQKNEPDCRIVYISPSWESTAWTFSYDDILICCADFAMEFSTLQQISGCTEGYNIGIWIEPLHARHTGAMQEVYYICRDAYSLYEPSYHSADILRPQFINGEPILAKRADMILTVTPQLQQLLYDKYSVDSHLIPSGVVQKQDLSKSNDIENKVFVLITASEERLDMASVITAANQNHNYIFNILGLRLTYPVPNNVRCYPKLPYPEMLSMIKTAYCGLIPYKPHPYNLHCNPLKLYHYAYAQLPVIAMNCPFVQQTKVQGVTYASNKDDFIAAVHTALSQPNNTDEILETHNMRNIIYNVYVKYFA